jgi:hypothetical protein
MSRAASARSFAREITFALGASLVTAAAGAALGFVLQPATVVRTIAAALGIACLLRALGQGSAGSGRLTAIAVFAAGTALAWMLAPTLAAFIGIELAMLWLARALVLYTSLREAALDLGVFATGAAFAVWAAARTGSLALAVWCLLLAVALTACLPAVRWQSTGAQRAAPDDSSRDFGEALKAAEAALARLAAGQR